LLWLRILFKGVTCYGIKALRDIAAYFSWLFYPLPHFPNFPFRIAELLIPVTFYLARVIHNTYTDTSYIINGTNMCHILEADEAQIPHPFVLALTSPTADMSTTATISFARVAYICSHCGAAKCESTYFHVPILVLVYIYSRRIEA